MESHNRNLFPLMLKEEILIDTAHSFHVLGKLLFLAFITSCLVSVSAPTPAALWIWTSLVKLGHRETIPKDCSSEVSSLRNTRPFLNYTRGQFRMLSFHKFHLLPFPDQLHLPLAPLCLFSKVFISLSLLLKGWRSPWQIRHLFSFKQAFYGEVSIWIFCFLITNNLYT